MEERRNGETEEWTRDIAALRELEVELTELVGKINKLQTDTWVGNGVEIEIWGHQTPFQNVVCLRETLRRPLGRTSSEPSGGETSPSLCGRELWPPTRPKESRCTLPGARSFPHRYNHTPTRDWPQLWRAALPGDLGRDLIRNVWCSFRLRLLLALLASVDADV